MKTNSQWFAGETENIHTFFLTELHQFEKRINEQFTSLKNNCDAQQIDPSQQAIEKNKSRVFLARNSILTDLFEISHFQSLRNAFAATLILLFMQDTISDYIADGRLDLDYRFLIDSFGKPHIALFVWSIMQLSTIFVIFYGFTTWVHNRKSVGQQSKIYDTIWLLLYLIYLSLFLIIPCRQIVKYELPVASAFIILLEQLRQLMKSHSFIRENITKLSLLTESKTTDKSLLSPELSHYIYFLFAPTLIYRENYPRSSTIRWQFVFQMFGQVLACMLYVYYVIIRFCIPLFSNLDRNTITLSIFVSTLFSSILPGSLFLLLGFYGFLHCWLNGFAELLRFADRMFYKDWWNSTSFAIYYRTWNVVVQDWLYIYVYREIYLLIGKRSKIVPTICVVILSAVFHEYVMMFALGFFYPVMFVFFAVFGLMLLFVLRRNQGVIYNILVWLCLLIGVGLQACFYFMESYARKACPENDTFWDKVIPRSIVCRVKI